MRAVLMVAVALAVAFFAIPMVVGGSSNACQALEKYKVSKTASSIAGGNSGPVYGVMNSVGQMGATGQGAAEVEANNHPNTPTPISCTVEFWKSL
jgi:hypothetical protein